MTHRKLTRAGIKISLANPQGPVKEILLLTSMDTMFPFYDSAAATAQQSKPTAVSSR